MMIVSFWTLCHLGQEVPKMTSRFTWYIKHTHFQSLLVVSLTSVSGP